MIYLLMVLCSYYNCTSIYLFNYIAPRGKLFTDIIDIIKKIYMC